MSFKWNWFSFSMKGIPPTTFFRFPPLHEPTYSTCNLGTTATFSSSVSFGGLQALFSPVLMRLLQVSSSKQASSTQQAHQATNMRGVFSHLMVFPVGRAFSHLIFIFFRAAACAFPAACAFLPTHAPLVHLGAGRPAACAFSEPAGPPLVHLEAERPATYHLWRPADSEMHKRQAGWDPRWTRAGPNAQAAGRPALKSTSGGPASSLNAQAACRPASKCTSGGSAGIGMHRGPVPECTSGGKLPRLYFFHSSANTCSKIVRSSGRPVCPPLVHLLAGQPAAPPIKNIEIFKTALVFQGHTKLIYKIPIIYKHYLRFTKVY